MPRAERTPGWRSRMSCGATWPRPCGAPTPTTCCRSSSTPGRQRRSASSARSCLPAQGWFRRPRGTATVAASSSTSFSGARLRWSRSWSRPCSRIASRCAATPLARTSCRTSCSAGRSGSAAARAVPSRPTRRTSPGAGRAAACSSWLWSTWRGRTRSGSRAQSSRRPTCSSRCLWFGRAASPPCACCACSQGPRLSRPARAWRPRDPRCAAVGTGVRSSRTSRASAALKALRGGEIRRTRAGF
mmetsp:Transcript_21735/g.64768  ORF Transcript_21735/g.64768 Transcript_21735/m.64768 type:complete len:244 (+) Transcript_21735:494-1225(+)